MFLNYLDKKQKELFLELVAQGMEVEGVLSPREESILDGFRQETLLMDYELTQMDCHQVISALKGASKKVHKVIMIELLACLPQEEDKTQMPLLRLLATEWNIRDRDLKKMLRWVDDFNEIVEEGYEFILK